MNVAKKVSVALLASTVASAAPPQDSRASRIDAAVAQAMQATGAKGLAIALIENGNVRYVRSFGARNASGAPLQPRTIMYGASLTKAAFGYMVMQLVEEGKLDLDKSIADYLPKPLPAYPAEERYGPWPDLAGDDRWRKLTPRILLSHGGGFPNYEWDEPDGKLRIHFDPNSRYAYSGTGYILLQFVLEQGLGLDVGSEMQRRVFDRFDMKNTSMMWRSDFTSNLADGWDGKGRIEPHDERSKVRAAGSMDTTIEDMARLAAGHVRGDGLTRTGWKELTGAQLRIASKSQFPTLQPLVPTSGRDGLAAGLGVIVFKGPQGPGYFKGGHNDTTANMWVCLAKGLRCVVILSNDVRAEAAFPFLVRAALGNTGVPWQWEYGALQFAPPESAAAP